MKLLKEFYEACVNLHNLGRMLVFSLLVYMVSNSWKQAILTGFIYLVVMIITWIMLVAYRK